LPGSTAVAERPEEEKVMPTPVDLEPQAKAVVDANAAPPFLFELGPDQGRRTVDAVQSGPVNKLTVDIEDTTVPGGPSGQVSVRILRPQGTPGRWR
jgi:acetyl esterase